MDFMREILRVEGIPTILERERNGSLHQGGAQMEVARKLPLFGSQLYACCLDEPLESNRFSGHF